MKQSEVNKIVKIVDHVLSSSVLSNRRLRENVDARVILTKILMDKGLNVTQTSKYLSKDHSSIVHYKKQFNSFIATDVMFKNKYNMCLREVEESNEKVFEMSESELISLSISLKEKINQLYLEISDKDDKINHLKNTIDRNNTHSELFDYIRKNTPKGKEKDLFIKVRSIINGLY